MPQCPGVDPSVLAPKPIYTPLQSIITLYVCPLHQIFTMFPNTEYSEDVRLHRNSMCRFEAILYLWGWLKSFLCVLFLTDPHPLENMYYCVFPFPLKMLFWHCPTPTTALYNTHWPIQCIQNSIK